MEFIDTFKEAIHTLTLNKMRTGLAVLGIIIGISSVIALMSLGQGSQQAITNQIQSLGSNLLTVIPGGRSSGGIRSALGSGNSLTMADADAIITHKFSTVKLVSPEVNSRSQVSAGRENTNTQIAGVVPIYAEIHKVNMALGNFITDADVASSRKVAVLGAQSATDLFPDSSNPIGETVRINRQIFTVIGVAASKGGSGFNNPDDSIFIPLSTARMQLTGSDNLSSIAIEATSQEAMTTAQNEVGYFLLSRHKLNSPASADFMIMSQNDILNTASSVTGTFTALLSGIAAISLLVGGIGIMNIMLVTVTERTREIGLRKALGAKKKTIILQFLIEAVILTIVGGVIGIVFGISISYVLATLIGMPFVVQYSSIGLSIGVSGIIGLIFGWYPARKAAQLLPIEALRYE